MSRQFWANLAICLLLGSLVVFALVNMGTALTPKGLLVSDPRPSAEAAPLLPHVRLTGYSYGLRPGRRIEANFTIRNNSPSDVKNIRVLCEFMDEGQKKMVDRKWWMLPETVPAGREVRIASVTEQFVNTMAGIPDCRVADFQLVKEPFFTLDRAAESDHDEPAGEGHDTGSSHGGGH